MADALGQLRAIVTGAGRGIGAAIAGGLAASGAHVVFADIDEAAAREAASRSGPNARAVRVDVRDRNSVRTAVDVAVDEFGGLDAMFNNAGIVKVMPFMDVTEDDFRSMMEVNALGVLLGMQEACRQMRKQGTGGSIVNTASIAGKQGYGFFMQYCASKFAVVGITQAGAKEMAKDRMTRQRICPGVVDTHMWKVIDQGFQNARLTQNEGDFFKQAAAQALLGRPSRPEDLVGVACFLASRNSEFITGQSIVVDGGIVFS